MSISKAMQYGFTPQTSLKDGLKRTWAWFKAYPKEFEQRWNYFADRKN